MNDVSPITSIENYCKENNIQDGFKEWAIGFSKSNTIGSIDGLYKKYYLVHIKDKAVSAVKQDIAAASIPIRNIFETAKPER